MSIGHPGGGLGPALVTGCNIELLYRLLFYKYTVVLCAIMDMKEHVVLRVPGKLIC